MNSRPSFEDHLRNLMEKFPGMDLGITSDDYLIV